MKILRRFGLLATALLAAAIVFAPLMFYKTPISKADGPGKQQSRSKPVPGAAGKFVLTEEAGSIVCRNATAEESLDLFYRSPDLQLKPISPIRPNQTGLKIILRGTNQLNSFPQAKSAFIKAAAKWEAIIASPITMVIDVDFGPRRFGQPYPSGVLGSTFSQEIFFGDASYALIRERLIDLASNNAEMALYEQLPQGKVPTDFGDTGVIASASAIFRALEFLDPVADPDGQEGGLGPPPSIGFNSSFEFDFNPDDGIAFNTFDFDAVAVHEIGHALGFNSNAGDKEAFPSSRLSLTLWDIFRFRPDAGKSFTTAPRILSTSGDQVFFVNEIDELPLSTGGPFGSAGDGFQSSHWKSRNSGGYIGIMDPAIPRGSRSLITKNDITALDYFGYQIRDRIMPNFRLSATPASQTIIPGESASYTVSLQEVGGFSGAVNLSASVSPSDASVAASLSTASIVPGGSAVLTVSTTASAPSSTFTITIRGASGQFVKTKTVTVTVNKTNFNLSLDPAQATVNPGSAVAFTIGAQGVGGFTGTIGLSASVSPSNAGITTVLSTASINPGGLVILTVNAAATTPIANYVITITGRSGQFTRTVAGTLAVGGGGGGNFSLSLNPSQVTVGRGQAAPFTIGVQGTGGFSNPVDLSIAIGPSDGTVTATLSTTTVTPGGTASLTVNTSANTPLSTFTITVTGRSGQSARTATAMVIVSGPDFSLGFNSPQVALTQKQKGQFTVNVNRISGFAGRVTVTAPDTKALKIKITQPSISTTGASVSFDFKVKKAAPLGTQQVTFTGRDDSGRVRTGMLTITIQ